MSETDTWTAGSLDRRSIALDALTALDEAGVSYALRNGRVTVENPAGDLDVLVRPADVRLVDRVLTRAGWNHLRAPGRRGHRFYLREAADRTWMMLDVVTALRYDREVSGTSELLSRRRRVDGVWLVSASDAAQHTAHRAAGRRQMTTRWERLLRAMPVSLRRSGCIVAVLGPDGAGKGTVTAAVAASLPMRVTQIYLGDRVAQAAGEARAAEQRLARGRPDAVSATPPQSGPRRTAGEIWFLLRRLGRWLPPLAQATIASWRGHVVLTDRHPLDALAVRPPRTPLAGAFERFVATRVVPSPDAIVVLDAPGEVLYARKGEHDPQGLEQWRQGYRDRLVPRGATLVDASGAIEDTVAECRRVVWQSLSRRRGWPTR